MHAAVTRSSVIGRHAKLTSATMDYLQTMLNISYVSGIGIDFRHYNVKK